MQLQIQYNNNLGIDAAALLFGLGYIPPTNADPYMNPRPERDESPVTNTFSIQPHPTIDKLPISDKSKLLYHVNRVTGVHRLWIPPSVVPDIFAIAHGEGHPDFSRYYEIIARFWFIHGLIKLLRSFIRHCPQCLALQTRCHPLYRSLQPIKSLPVSFFILILDFVLTLPLTKEKFNAIISMTCKFSKRVTFIEGADTRFKEDWAHAFLKRLDLIDWGFSGQLITDHDPKFLSKF